MNRRNLLVAGIQAAVAATIIGEGARPHDASASETSGYDSIYWVPETNSFREFRQEWLDDESLIQFSYSTTTGYITGALFVPENTGIDYSAYMSLEGYSPETITFNFFTTSTLTPSLYRELSMPFGLNGGVVAFNTRVEEFFRWFVAEHARQNGGFREDMTIYDYDSNYTHEMHFTPERHGTNVERVFWQDTRDNRFVLVEGPEEGSLYASISHGYYKEENNGVLDLSGAERIYAQQMNVNESVLDFARRVRNEILDNQ